MPGRRRKTPFMNRLSMEERTLIIGLLRLAWSERRIALETGHDGGADCRDQLRRGKPRN